LFLRAVHFKKDAISKIFRFTGSDGDMLLNSHILKCTSAAMPDKTGDMRTLTVLLGFG
jgi:hypothetical protein